MSDFHLKAKLHSLMSKILLIELEFELILHKN